GVLNLLVGLEVPFETPPVEVARAYRHPVIADDHFGVEHAWLVLEDPHAVTQHLSIVAARRLPHPRMIGERPGHQQANIHTATRTSPKRLAKAPGRHEIRAHDPGSRARRIDTPHNTIREHRALASLTQGHPTVSTIDKIRARSRIGQAELPAC